MAIKAYKKKAAIEPDDGNVKASKAPSKASKPAPKGKPKAKASKGC